jgi:hypothetical protein
MAPRQYAHTPVSPIVLSVAATLKRKHYGNTNAGTVSLTGACVTRLSVALSDVQRWRG